MPREHPSAAAMGCRQANRRAKKTQTTTSAVAAIMLHATGLMQQEAGKRETEERLELLQLTDARDAADRKAAVPEDEADEHAEDRDVGEPDPGRRTDAAPCRRPGQDRDRHHQRHRKQQRPGDHLPAAEAARQSGAFGIAEPAQHDRGDHQQIAGE
ncbi:type IV secretory pathway VirB10-like protein [Bradyrhizobium diazoefficiens]